MNLIKSVINRLNDPFLVAKVQSTLGLEFIGIETNTSDNKEQNSNPSKTPVDNQLRHRDVKTYPSQSSNLDINKQQKNTRRVNMLDNKVCLYSVNNSFFYWFFMIITRMGNEIFYIVFLPVLLWNFNEKVMVLACIAWGVCMFIGQTTKDLIRIPRPLTPPAVKLEENYLLEYGFPSTHSMAAMSISFTIIASILTDKTLSDYHNHKLELLILGGLSCVFVSLSRVYLGMHSILDVVGGLIYSFFISLVLFLISDYFLAFIRKSTVYGFLVYLIFVFLCSLYPCKDRWSSARADTFLILGVAGGIVMGYSIRSVYKWNNVGKLRYGKNETALDKSMVILLRTFVGLVAVLIIRGFGKLLFKTMIRLRPNMAKLNNENFKDLIKKNFSIELFYYFFTYSNVSFTAGFTSFVLFEYFKLY